jgi:hypothetical protein
LVSHEACEAAVSVSGVPSADIQPIASRNRDPLAKRIAKLVRAGGDERHLFLRVTFSGLEESALVRLMQYSMVLRDTDPMQGEPDLREKIGHLWLLTGWGQRVSWWTRGEG